VDEEQFNKRLNQISTVWSLVHRAHSGPADDRVAAQAALMQRYQRAIYRYLLHSVGYDADDADDILQEFALRLVRGDFRNASPDRGRFRDLVRTALINLVINYHKQRARRRKVVTSGLDSGDQVPDPAFLDQGFLEHWRQALLDRTWLALSVQHPEGGPPFFAALRIRCEHPEASSRELAELLSNRLKPDKPYTEVNFRKTLQRAREQFSALLIDEVTHSIGSSDRDLLEAELGELGLLPYCRKALENNALQDPPLPSVFRRPG
jgi:RNA polymerase sigma-70 factor (ECF subfamily)